MRTKTCTCCNLAQTVYNYHRDRTHQDGYRTVCKACRKQKLNATGTRKYKVCQKCSIRKPSNVLYFPEYRHATARRRFKTLCRFCYNDSRKGAHLKHRYGITKDTYKKMAASQNFRCPICNEEKKLHVDHSHETRQVRGLLCSECNRGIGFLRENISALQNAIQYLQKGI